MTEQVLEISKSGAVATVAMNRPNQFNALNAELRSALRNAIAEIDKDVDVRLAILKGNGRGFCAGADLTGELKLPVSKQIDEEFKPILTGIAQSPKIWVAQVHGSAAGIGAAIAMNCDLLAMADDANIYMAFAAIALIPDGGNTQLLLNNMGYHRAMQAILEGRKIPADECLQYGIANALHRAGDLDAATLVWAQKLATGAPLAMGAAKRLLRQVGHLPFDEAINVEGREQDPLVESADFRAGVSAFFAREKPVFTGK